MLLYSPGNISRERYHDCSWMTFLINLKPLTCTIYLEILLSAAECPQKPLAKTWRISGLVTSQVPYSHEVIH